MSNTASTAPIKYATILLFLINILTVNCTSEQLVGVVNDSIGSESSEVDSDSTDEALENCGTINEHASNSQVPRDIIFIIDNTPSMADEIAEVRAKMNAFSKQVVNFGVDARIVLISCLPGDCYTSDDESDTNANGICIAPPLGHSDGCHEIEGQTALTNDSNPPLYTHISTRVPSKKALEWFFVKYLEFKPILRANAKQHIVVVSDNTDETTAQSFHTQLQELDPPLFSNYVFHGIFSEYSKEDACQMEPVHPCCYFAPNGGEGIPYKELVTLTNGKSGDLCSQNFDSVFSSLVTTVVEDAVLSCTWDIPDLPDEMKLSPKMTTVTYDNEQTDPISIDHINSADRCTTVQHGWHFDNPDQPKLISVCPQTCQWIQGDITATMNINLSCSPER